MSVKLGNTNIAGTQVLYSTTGNNTDGAMTQATTTTQLNLKADDTNVVHKTSDEIISGEKTFNNAINLANGTWNAVGDDAYIGDRNYAGGVCIKGNNSYTKLMLFDRAETVALGFYVDESDQNALKLTAPTYSSTAWGSVTAMINQVLSSSGYVKYNNGLIIQWGRVSNTSNNNITVTFPTSFTSTNYSINAMRTNVNSGYSYDGITGISSRNTTSCILYSHYGSSEYDWIAIGY